MDELYVLARRTLLDALEALGPHQQAVTLVGAQAIYARVGEADLAVAPYTTDGDLVIDPSRLDEIPPLEQCLTGAGFTQSKQVGTWCASRPTAKGSTNIEIDLLVPRVVSPGQGRRAANLPGHDKLAARIVNGLEGALIDCDPMALQAFEPSDSRIITINVAGAAALLIAKLHKIDDRQGSPRLNAKDALDAFRLLRGEIQDLTQRYQQLLNDSRTQNAAQKGITLLGDQFGTARSPGVTLLLQATGGLEDPSQMTASCVALAQELLHSIGS